MCQINPVTLLNQMAALKEFAEGKVNDECSIALYSDGSIMVDIGESGNITGIGFDTLTQFIKEIGDYKRD